MQVLGVGNQREEGGTDCGEFTALQLVRFSSVWKEDSYPICNLRDLGICCGRGRGRGGTICVVVL